MAPNPEVLDVSPYTDKNLHTLGYSKHWGYLRRILGPLTSSSFAVVDGFTQALIDDTRRRFDASSSDCNHGAILIAADSSHTDERAIGDAVELLLSIGADPDIPDKGGWRASHATARRGREELARIIFFCRPSMEAKNANGDTPLKAAQKLLYKDEDQFPERPALRKEVKKIILNSGFLTAFPTIAELAVKKRWFAVKNLIRRQVVHRTEFQATYYKKTAAEWAQHYGEHKIAEELRYYEKLPTAKILQEAEEEIDRLRKELQIVEDQVEALTAELPAAKASLAEVEQKIADLQRECGEKDTKSAELCETVAVMSGRLDGSLMETDGRRRRRRTRKMLGQDSP